MGAMKDLAIDRMNAERQPEWFISRKVSIDYVLKNSLEKAAYEEIRKLDRWIVNVEHVDKFIMHVKDIVARINAEHPRCKPIELSVYNGDKYQSEELKKHDIDMYLSCNMHLKLYAYKGFAVNQENVEVYKL